MKDKRDCCKGCGKRWINIETGENCHTNCPDYAKLRELISQENKERRKNIVIATPAKEKKNKKQRLWNK